MVLKRFNSEFVFKKLLFVLMKLGLKLFIFDFAKTKFGSKGIILGEGKRFRGEIRKFVLDQG